MRRQTLRPRWMTLATALTTVAATVFSGFAASAASPSDPERPAVSKLRIERTVVPMPGDVTGVGHCRWTPDSVALLCQAELGDRGRHIIRVRPDGADFACLTCSATIPEGRRIDKIAVFPDGERFLIGTLPASSQNADEGASQVNYVVECVPSIYDCASASLLPVSLPENTGSLNDREPRLSLDGRKFVYTIVRADGFLMLMGDLVRTDTGYDVRDPRVLNAGAPTTAEGRNIRGAFSEAKSFSDENTILYAGTQAQGLNPDVHRMDLRTGQTTRVTFNGEWDEDAADDPRGRYLAVGSARRVFNTVRGATLLPKPSFLDYVWTPIFARFKLANLEERRRALEPWITDDATEANGGGGARLLSDLHDGWDARMPIVWSPDGTQLTFWEHGPNDAFRTVVIRFPQLRQIQTRCADGCPTPTPEWAPLLADYPVQVQGTQVIAGPAGGRAVITSGGLVIGGALRVDYFDYTLADGTVLNGSESLTGFAIRDFRIDMSTDITASGSSTGTLSVSGYTIGRRACAVFQSALGDRTEETVWGRADPQCGFGPPSECGNRIDDDGDGYEDLTDADCRDENDPQESGGAGAATFGSFADGRPTPPSRPRPTGDAWRSAG